MSDVPFFQTRMGVRFFEHDVPRLIEALRVLAGLEPFPVPTRPAMTKERFERELKDIQSSFPFQNMLEYFPHLKDEPVHKIALIYHAFGINCSTVLFENPFVIGGYVHRCVMSPENLAAYVSEAREVWGPR